MTLNKYVIAAIQQDLIFCFKLPQCMLYDVDRQSVEGFLWSHPEDKQENEFELQSTQSYLLFSDCERHKMLARPIMLNKYSRIIKK